LFGTGTLRLNDQTEEVERVGGVIYTIKDGIIYDAGQLRAGIRDQVARRKAELGIPPGPMKIESVDRSR
jgi:hypothetical protein